MRIRSSDLLALYNVNPPLLLWGCIWWVKLLDAFRLLLLQLPKGELSAFKLVTSGVFCCCHMCFLLFVKMCVWFRLDLLKPWVVSSIVATCVFAFCKKNVFGFAFWALKPHSQCFHSCHLPSHCQRERKWGLEGGFSSSGTNRSWVIHILQVGSMARACTSRAAKRGTFHCPWRHFHWDQPTAVTKCHSSQWCLMVTSSTALPALKH